MYMNKNSNTPKPIFNFCISFDDGYTIFSKNIQFGKCYINVDERTNINIFSENDSSIIILGIAIHVVSGDTDGIAEYLLKHTNSIQDVIEKERNLGGKYVIIYRHKEEYYVIGDATCSIPLYYAIVGERMECATSAKYLAEKLHYNEDEQFLKIRKSGELSQAMPWDITIYREIKQLLPNHYLDINEHKSVRFLNLSQKEQTLSPEKSADELIPFLKNMIIGYKKFFDIMLPITGGRDSRVVLAVFYCLNKNVKTYTIKHLHHDEADADLMIPVKLCKYMNIQHEQLEDIKIPEEWKHHVDECLGTDRYSLKTLRIAATIYEKYRGAAILNGDIIGQVGKSSLHRNIPEELATPSYFCCKIHNYSKDAKMLMKQWMNEVVLSGEKTTIFDLFSIENRMGRWAAQSSSIYNVLGQPSLNIFNSRRIIYNMCKVPRDKRMNNEIHSAIIKKINPKFQNVQYDMDKKFIHKLILKNKYLYYIAIFIKHWISSIQFKLKKRNI